jgi:protein-disulfide isomerase
MLGRVVVTAVATGAIGITVSSCGASTRSVKPGPRQASKQDAPIFSLLAGIPESGNTIGSPTAKVTVTEFGDLESPICRAFALGIENQLIKSDVKSGKVRLVYRSLETATGKGPNPAVFGIQQASALAAGVQDKEWQYVELFYHQQGPEKTGYVTQAYLNNLAKQIPDLNFSKWLSDSHSQTLLSQVSDDKTTATGKGFNSTPTLIISGPKGQTQPIVGAPSSYGQLESAINLVL